MCFKCFNEYCIRNECQFQVTEDLEEADKKRKEEFKQYEMQKEFEQNEKMKTMDEEHKKKYQEELEEMKKKHQKHEPVIFIFIYFALCIYAY